MKSDFRLFYSWQSDLPGKDTRNFISDVINSAVKFLSGTVTVVPDRDTSGELGSPNIETTIFDKIDGCDLFIADLSIVGEYEDSDGKKKYTPNPNVLIELGYAVKVLSWERIICFINTDYGQEAALPFDLNHHRVTGYSLSNYEKAEVRKELRDIVSSTVLTLMENGPRPKAGFAGHIVGGYSAEFKTVANEIIPVYIQKQSFVDRHRSELLNEVKVLLESAIEIKILPQETIEEKSACEENTSKFQLDLFKWKKFVLNKNDVEMLKEDALKYLNITLDDSFFELGDLEIKTVNLVGMSNDFRGSDASKDKYDKIVECMGLFAEIDLFDEYLKTFEGIVGIPLAIWNNTTVADADISVSIIIDNECAEVIEPDERMINPTIKEIAGLVYDQHFIEHLFSLPECADISKEYDLQVPNNAEIRAQMARMNSNPLFGYSEPTYDMDDYVEEIKKFIAEPINRGGNEFYFYIKKLRPNEKEWLGKYILLKPKKDDIKITYKITSESTDGNLSGELTCKLEKE